MNISFISNKGALNYSDVSIVRDVTTNTTSFVSSLDDAYDEGACTGVGSVLNATSCDIPFLFSSNASELVTYSLLNVTAERYLRGNLSNATVHIYDNVTKVLVSENTTLLDESSFDILFGTMVTLADGVYEWFYTAFDIFSNEGTSGNFTLSIDATGPSITLDTPTTDLGFSYLGANISLNFSVNDTHLDSCWYVYDGGIIPLNCSENSSFLLTDRRNITVYVNDTFGTITELMRAWTAVVQNNTNMTYNLTTYETANETFTINATGVTDANLVYDGTSYPATVSGSDISVSLDIPLLSPETVTNRSMYWTFNSGSVTSTLTYNHSVSPIYFGICGAAPLTTAHLNMTFRDETTLQAINATIPNMNVQYNIGSGTVNKEYLYSSTTPNMSYTFCFTPNETVNIDVDMQYARTEYVTRTRAGDLYTLTNDTLTTVDLALLSVSSGGVLGGGGSSGTISSGIQVYDITTGLPIYNALVSVSRLIDNSYADLTSQYTGSDGKVSLYMDSSYQHRVIMTADGYYNSTVYFTPSSTVYPTYLTPISSPYGKSNLSNVTFSTAPQSGLLNHSMHNITFFVNKSSTYSSASAFRIIVSNSTGIVNMTMANLSSGLNSALGLMINTSNQTKLTARFYISTSDSPTVWVLVSTAGYDIVNIYEGGNSILHAIKTMATLTDDYEDNFTVIFFTLLVVIIAYAGFTKYTGIEIQNPGMSMMAFSIVVIGLCAGDAIPVGYSDNVFISQWGFAVLTTLATVGYMLGKWRDS